MRIYISIYLSIYYEYMRISLINDGSLTFSEFTKPPFLSFGIIKTRNTNSECQSPQLATRLTGAPNDIETLGTNGYDITNEYQRQGKLTIKTNSVGFSSDKHKKQVSTRIKYQNIFTLLSGISIVFPHFLITWNNNCWFFRFSNFFIIFFASVFLQKKYISTFSSSTCFFLVSGIPSFKKNDHLGLNCI